MEIVTKTTRVDHNRIEPGKVNPPAAAPLTDLEDTVFGAPRGR